MVAPVAVLTGSRPIGRDLGARAWVPYWVLSRTDRSTWPMFQFDVGRMLAGSTSRSIDGRLQALIVGGGVTVSAGVSRSTIRPLGAALHAHRVLLAVVVGLASSSACRASPFHTSRLRMDVAIGDDAHRLDGKIDRHRHRRDSARHSGRTAYGGRSPGHCDRWRRPASGHRGNRSPPTTVVEPRTTYKKSCSKLPAHQSSQTPIQTIRCERLLDHP